MGVGAEGYQRAGCMRLRLRVCQRTRSGSCFTVVGLEEVGVGRRRDAESNGQLGLSLHPRSRLSLYP